MVKIALADDHVLLRTGLVELLRQLEYSVLLEANNGRDLIEGIQKGIQPDLVLLDINMPGMDGYAAAAWLKDNRPEIKVLVLSMYDDETAIVRMLRNGALGYILKDADPPELKAAIDEVMAKGFHYSDLVTGKLIHSIRHGENEKTNNGLMSLNDREIEFLRLASTELTYKEIADKMYLSPRTIDGYRDALFEKLNVRNRVGLVLYAIRHKIIYVD